MPRGPGTTPVSRARFPATLSPTTASVSAATIHRGPPASHPCIQRYIIAHGRPEASSLHISLALCCSNHRWGKPSSRHQTKHNILATALLRLYDFNTLINITYMWYWSCLSTQHQSTSISYWHQRINFETLSMFDQANIY
jgi:hypothetical protein